MWGVVTENGRDREMEGKVGKVQRDKGKGVSKGMTEATVSYLPD